MQDKTTTINEYLDSLPEDRKVAINKLRKVITNTIPNGLEECPSYGMIGYVVPHKLFPDGYHCNPKLSLPFINIASQKNFIAIYHMGIYMDSELMNWFVTKFPKHCTLKLDMGKSCIRFKKTDQIPYELIGELVQKMTVENWLDLYTKQLKR
jgi:uncharacterized protein YdhG (YjbR/CyaY superfamily)